MATVDAFMPQVWIHAPAATDPLVRMCIVSAAREFCDRSLIWRDWLACVKSVSPVTEYTFTLPTGAEIVRLEAVTLDDAEVPVESFTAPALDWQASPADLEQQAITDDLVKFRLTGAEVSGTVKARVALKPTTAATTLPDLLASRYLEGICAGAAARVLSTVGAEFYRPMDAQVLRDAFEASVAAAAGDVFRGLRSQRPRVRPQWC